MKLPSTSTKPERITAMKKILFFMGVVAIATSNILLTTGEIKGDENSNCVKCVVVEDKYECRSASDGGESCTLSDGGNKCSMSGPCC